ncbi:phosphatase PAP2 family protein, partial [Proteiniphilum sp. UBA1028]|uniref:phosphatase PAP2 family protein n=1 Tax=Proteiniphilum sp. UBA1028 TaxID=1947251 RepID=UPI0025E0909D
LLFQDRRVTIAVIFWALLNSYTRVYLGVHFVSDILAGMIVGSVLGYLFYELLRLTRSFLLHLPESKNIPLYSRPHAHLLSIFIPSYLAVLIIFSSFLATLPH